ncbi:protein kinase [Perkinsela sp. CCAP 1560/4]|nr:protein kinase [Perkinsela sp. CCAP 1560/4]|eukprot:KNH09770.1 protein kinase [Perkinsela sp. CCAP 1560/4]
MFLPAFHIVMASLNVRDFSLEQSFDRAVGYVRTSDPIDSATFDKATKLSFYGLYKQAMVGDCNVPQPWVIKVEARAKWEAWNGYKGLTREEAMEQYIQKLQEHVPSFLDN